MVDGPECGNAPEGKRARGVRGEARCLFFACARMRRVCKQASKKERKARLIEANKHVAEDDTRGRRRLTVVVVVMSMAVEWRPQASKARKVQIRRCRALSPQPGLNTL